MPTIEARSQKQEARKSVAEEASKQELRFCVSKIRGRAEEIILVVNASALTENLEN